MLPSLLARDVRAGVKQFLVTGFEPADDFFHGVLRRFVENEAAWTKGPYLQIGLPFRHHAVGRGFFPDFQTERPAYTHQHQAWQRLASDGLAASTLVATGTGSGKTECFVYPILDHCARARQLGQGGIKALVIYPMNALAADQARRFAGLIASTPALAGLRVGLFVGGAGGPPGSGTMMTPESVITDRAALRRQPPDVLLTNYKMLDYLLIRPRDRDLWAKNGPDTLRYVVVDELHTFDGAQGTDLALLLRRLKARLGTPDGGVIYVGTSATLGGAADTLPLREYARQVFGVAFDAAAVITENRLSAAEFLGDAPIEHVLQHQPDLADILDPDRHDGPETAVAAWAAVFFPEVAFPADAGSRAFRVMLGELLKRHLLFVNLLKLLRGGVVSLHDLQLQMQGPLPQPARPHIRLVLDALLALTSWARAADGQMPLVTVRLHVWMRELRRMVARVTPESAAVELRPDKDLKAGAEGLYLPLIQCSECHATGWLSRLPPASKKLSARLDEIYNTWFAGRSEAVRLYPELKVHRPQVDGADQFLCCTCGNLQSSEAPCQACGAEELVRVFRTTGTRSSTTRGGAAMAWHDSTCPACGARDRQVLLGARIATLGSQVIEGSWASLYNDDKKLIAFSDSVQDAAHRAGFFAARTYANTVRTAIARAVDFLVRPTLLWNAFLERFEKLWQEEGSPLAMTRERLVAELIAPNMTWQRDWAQELLEKDALPLDSRLPERVQKRLAWQAVAEFTYLSRRGRNLDRIGKATLAPRTALVEQAAQDLLPRLQEELGLRTVTKRTVFHWLWGWLTHLRQRGGVMHPAMGGYVRDGNVYALAGAAERRLWMPTMGERVPHPVFLTLGSQTGFDRLTGQSAAWYAQWLSATIGAETLLPKNSVETLYLAAIEAVVSAGLCLRTGRQDEVIALDPGSLDLHSQTAGLRSAQGRRRLTVPAEAAERLVSMPCLDAPQETYETAVETEDWWAARFSKGDLRRVIAAEHTGLLDRSTRERLEQRFKAKQPAPWYENLLSATPTLEMGVDIGDLSSVLLCSVPPGQASFLQRVGRAGRRDGNALATTFVDGNSPHDLYFFEETEEMLAGDVTPPGVFLGAAEVLRRQLFAYCLDDWVGSGIPETALPERTSKALDALESRDFRFFPYTFCDHVLTNEPRLLQGFLALLGPDADEQTRGRLSDYLTGAGETDALRVRLLKVLGELLEERKAYRKRAQQLRDQIKALQDRPMDEATASEIDELKRARDGMMALANGINRSDLLGTLTVAGLIPNYAFPEAGIQLRSVLWRQRTEDDKGEGKYVSLPTITYERPAVSALSEFAPENRFYANQRRVEVDQINMDLAKLETWRFCPSCHHMENLTITADSHATCPRCGDVMWADAGQCRQMLRFRQALANSDDIRVRIDDSAEDREPRFYVRQLLVDFEASDIREAWKLAASHLPFGFEFIARATFRDVNFGELGKPGDEFAVANRGAQRPGFRLCRFCGKVQNARRHDGDGDAEQDHSIDCPKRDTADPGSIVDCLYLYREFSSEALRILVPYTAHGVDDEVVQSFIAALQLGLKKRFGGKVDHLRIMIQDEPGRDGGPRRQYVLLYDSVPGGTGYLHQLLAKNAATLAAVFQQALAAITGCPCNRDPEKDGCYRCLYQYRQGRTQELISRDRARRVLEELVGAMDRLERVPTISEIFINPSFGSALESRFIEALRSIGGQEGIPPVRLVQEIVNGKPGYLLETGTRRYWVEPQVDVGPDTGVAAASRPDFVMWPGKAASASRRIAVFCDGWTYHHDSLRDDARKRSALVASGKYWIWSVTSDDVKAALEGRAGTDLESPLTTMSHHDGRGMPSSVPRAEPQAFSRNAVAQLVILLSGGTPDKQDPLHARLRRNAIWASLLMVAPPRSREAADALARFQDVWNQLPDWAREASESSAIACSRADVEPALYYRWPPAFRDGTALDLWTPGALMLDDLTDTDDISLHLRWRRWLHLYNTFQTLTGVLLATKVGLLDRDYDVMTPPSPPIERTGEAATLQAWRGVLSAVVPDVRAGMEWLMGAGARPPDEIGYEHADGGGEVDAEAEAVWLSERLVVLAGYQTEFEPFWRTAGWVVVLARGDWQLEANDALQNAGVPA